MNQSGVICLDTTNAGSLIVIWNELTDKVRITGIIMAYAIIEKLGVNNRIPILLFSIKRNFHHL